MCVAGVESRWGCVQGPCYTLFTLDFFFPLSHTSTESSNMRFLCLTGGTRIQINYTSLKSMKAQTSGGHMCIWCLMCSVNLSSRGKVGRVWGKWTLITQVYFFKLCEKVSMCTSNWPVAVARCDFILSAVTDLWALFRHSFKQPLAADGALLHPRPSVCASAPVCVCVCVIVPLILCFLQFCISPNVRSSCRRLSVFDY